MSKKTLTSKICLVSDTENGAKMRRKPKMVENGNTNTKVKKGYISYKIFFFVAKFEFSDLQLIIFNMRNKWKDTINNKKIDEF